LENKGAGYARNMLLKKAKGDVIAFLDADDIWYPEKLARQLDLMNSLEADIVVSHYDVVNAGGDRIGSRCPPNLITNFKMHLRREIRTSMAIICSHVNGCRDMPLIRRRQDYAYWLRMFSINKNLTCVTVPEVMGAYYRMPGSLSSSMIKNFRANYVMFRHVMGYSALLSSVCLIGNVFTRLFRV